MEALAEAGVEVLDVGTLVGSDSRVAEQAARCPNLVFTRDSSAVTDAGAVLMRMGIPSRRLEAPVIKAAFDTLAIPVGLELREPMTFEGGGFALLEGRVAVAGLCSRTTRDALDTLRGFLFDNEVADIAIDGADHKWIGTWGGGVSEFDGGTWTTYTTADGLANNDVNAVAIDGDGHKWFGTWGGGASEFDGSTWITYTTTHGLGSNRVYDIAVDGAGHVWVSTQGGGVSEFDGNTWTTYNTVDGLAGNSVWAIAFDGDGHKWFGTYRDGVSQFDGSTWTTYTTVHGLVDNEVRALAVDGSGHMWIGTEAGLSEHITLDELVYLPLVVRNAQ